jgi:DNA-binding MarR family transcriptional regulator
MTKQQASAEIRQLEILEALEDDPEARQVDLASQLGLAVGTVNWALKRLAAKGYVKIKRIGQWNWQYLLTPQGVAQKAKLTKLYLKESMRLYRQIRTDAHKLLSEVQELGFEEVSFSGESGSDLADICALTCLELGLTVIDAKKNHTLQVPELEINGKELRLQLPDEVGRT